MKPPTFSVCIPNYNYAAYVGETIRSVLAQTWQRFEIVVADNASTDDSVAVVEKLAGSEEAAGRLRLIKNRCNIGFGPNLDRATASARGDFLILLSSDDLMRPTALEEYAAVLEALGDDAWQAVLTSAVDVIDGQGRLTGVMLRPAGELFYREVREAEAGTLPHEAQDTPGAEALAASLRRKDSPAAFLATCYSRRLYEQVEGYHNLQRIWPDSHFLNKLLSQEGTRLLYVPRRLFAYRVHDANQLAVEKKSGALTYQVDAYMHTVEFPAAVLARIGVERRELQRVFVEKAVMERGLQALAAGNWPRAFRCLAFGFATYPGLALGRGKTWALAALLALGPLAHPVAAALYRRHQRRRAGRVRPSGSS